MSATAPDGSPVGLYATLAPLGEPELIDAAVPPGSEILELGCGAGRLTHELLALRHPVVAVDNSPEMLAHVRGAETVLSDIETLQLDRTFPVVLLASNFLNATDDVSATMEYEANGERWTHSFRAKLISDADVDSALARAGLERVRWLDERRAWLEARRR